MYTISTPYNVIRHHPRLLLVRTKYRWFCNYYCYPSCLVLSCIDLIFSYIHSRNGSTCITCAIILHQSSGRYETIPSSRSVHGGRNCEVVCTVYKRNIFFYLFHFIKDCATSTYFRCYLYSMIFLNGLLWKNKKRYEETIIIVRLQQQKNYYLKLIIY